MHSTEMSTAQHELVPGTVHLIDLQHEMHVQHAGKKDIVLVPQPSNDPADPLRWSQWRKTQTTIILFFYGLITSSISGYTSAAFVEIIMEHPYITYVDLSHAAALGTLFAGWGNVWFMPMSNKLGRRFVYLLSLAIIIAGQGIYLSMHNRSMYLAQAAVTGIGIAPFEALIEISISDVYFAHERGTKLGIYIVSIAGGSFLGPLIGGYIATSMGWQWIVKFGMIFAAALWLVMFFLLPETKFIRDERNNELSLGEGLRTGSENNSATLVSAQADKKDASADSASDDIARHPTVDIGLNHAERKWYTGYTLWTVFPGSATDILQDTIQPFRVMWYPLLFWSGIVYGSCVCWLGVQAVTISAIFAAPPYLFKPSKIGNLAVASIIGTVIGSIYSGPVANWWVIRKTQKNGGYREPEFRLYTVVPGAFIMAGGLLIYGLAAAHGINYIVPAIGMALIAIGLTIGGAIIMAFVIDCYKEIAPQAVTAVIVIRNTMGFAITFGTTQWVENQGLQNTFITMGVLAWVIFMSAGAIILYGKKLRKLTATSYLANAARHGHQ